MKRSSIIRGLASWAGKEIKPRLPAYSPARLAIAGFEQLAISAPQAAENIAVSLFGTPFSALLNATAGDQFDAAADAIISASKNEEKMVITLAGVPYSLTTSDFQNIVNQIRTQEASLA